MPPFLFFILAILTPFGFCITLLVPIYLGIFGAVHAVYFLGPQHLSLTDRFSDVFYIVAAYDTLFQYWRHHWLQISFLRYSLPVLGLPTIGFFFALWLTRKFIRRVGDIFHMGTVS